MAMEYKEAVRGVLRFRWEADSGSSWNEDVAFFSVLFVARCIVHQGRVASAVVDGVHYCERIGWMNFCCAPTSPSFNERLVKKEITSYLNEIDLNLLFYSFVRRCLLTACVIESGKLAIALFAEVAETSAFNI